MHAVFKTIAECFLFFLFCSTGVWIQGLTLARQVLLLLEPLYQPFFCDGGFQDRVSQTFAQAGLFDPLDLCLLSS
jgi:hypothetical protein